MTKQIALLKSSAGTSRDALIADYEGRQVPLMRERTPDLRDGCRSYLIPADVGLEHFGDEAAGPDFDVVVEHWYDGEERDATAEEEVGVYLGADGDRLLDRSRTRIFGVSEHPTSDPKFQPRPAGHIGPPAVKLICLMKRRPGMSREDFIAHYDHAHVPLALRLLADDDGYSMIAGHSRSYPVSNDGSEHGTSELCAELGFDVLASIWFWNDEQFQTLGGLYAKPEVGAALTEDEDKVFDRDSIRMFPSEQYGSDPVEMAKQAQPG